MKLSFVDITTIALIVSTVSASPGAVKFDFHSFKNVHHHSKLNLNSISKSFNKFAGNLFDLHQNPPSPSASPVVNTDSVSNDVNLTTSYNFYLTNITIGTPPQSIEVGLDTGSPYLWVFGPESAYGNSPRFDPDQSSSFQWLNKNFTGLYGAGGVFGKWGTDNINIDDAGLDQFPFGVINQFELSSGVPGLMGVGPNSNLTNQTYANVPEAFYRQGITKTPAFSIFLDSQSNGGQVIFGGIDKAKFEEPVYSYDIVRSGGNKIYYYQLALSQVALNNGSPYDVFGIAVLDTGSPFSQLPPGFVNKVGQSLGLTYYDKYQVWYKPTNDTTPLDTSGCISLTFGKFTVEIPIHDLIVPGDYLWSTDGPSGSSGAQALALMGANSYVIGDHLFKNAYITLDSLGAKIYMAKGIKNSTSSDIVDLDEVVFPDAIAGAGGAAESSNPYQSFTYSSLTPRPPVTSATITSSGSIATITPAVTTTSFKTSAPLFYTY